MPRHALALSYGPLWKRPSWAFLVDSQPAMVPDKTWPDFLLINPAGLTHSLELKRQGETLSEEQAEFRRGVSSMACRTPSPTISRVRLKFSRHGARCVRLVPGRERRNGEVSVQHARCSPGTEVEGLNGESDEQTRENSEADRQADGEHAGRDPSARTAWRGFRREPPEPTQKLVGRRDRRQAAAGQMTR